MNCVLLVSQQLLLHSTNSKLSFKNNCLCFCYENKAIRVESSMPLLLLPSWQKRISIQTITTVNLKKYVLPLSCTAQWGGDYIAYVSFLSMCKQNEQLNAKIKKQKIATCVSIKFLNIYFNKSFPKWVVVLKLKIHKMKEGAFCTSIIISDGR